MAARCLIKVLYIKMVMFLLLKSVESFPPKEYATNINETQPQEVRDKRSVEWNLPGYLSRYDAHSSLHDNYKQVFAPMQKRDLSIDFRPLCETSLKHIHLEDNMYEYQPARYTEVHCKAYNTHTGTSDVISSNQRCVYPGFSCMPRSQTMYFLRRRFNAECWESFTREVPSGCDCMWPESSFGDISQHY